MGRLEILDFLCDCFTFWKRDFSHSRAISPSTRQNTVRVAKKNMNFKTSHAISFFFGFCNPYSVLELFNMTQKPVFGVSPLTSSQIPGSKLRQFHTLKKSGAPVQVPRSFCMLSAQIPEWILRVFHVFEVFDKKWCKVDSGKCPARRAITC